MPSCEPVWRVAAIISGAAAALIGVGCVPNSSNVSVSIESAQLRAAECALEIRIENPGGRDLTITQVRYELSEAATGLPLGWGDWTGELPAPHGGEATLPLVIGLQSQPLDETSTRVRLSGELQMTDHTGYLGIRSLELTSTAFQAEADAERAP